MSQTTLAGAMVALVTPLKEDRSLDRASLHGLLERCLAAGIAGIRPAGSTGEGPHLPRGLRTELIKEVIDAVGGRVPVIPAIAAPSTAGARQALADCAEAGANAALVAPPFYYPLPPAALERFFVDVAADAAIPLLLYNIPQMTKNAIPPAVVGRLARAPKIIGIKDSGHDFEYHMAVLDEVTALPDFSVLMGIDALLVPSLLMGGRGAIAASANLAPELCVGICAAMARGNLDTAREKQQVLHRVIASCRRGTFPAAWKAALAWAGLCQAWTMPPIPELDPAEAAALWKDLSDLNLKSV